MNERKLNINMKLSLICEASHRYEDMLFYLEELAKGKADDLNCDQRNLISLAFKNIITNKRKALKSISNIEKRKEIFIDCNEYIVEYRKKLQKELAEVIESIVNKVDLLLLPKAKDTESKVFYTKIKGDYYRYLAENLDPKENKEYTELSLKNYNDATALSKKLPAINPIRLGLALNFSVFYFELKHDKLEASKIAYEANDSVEEILEKMEEEDQETYKDSLNIIELLNENLKLWKEGKARRTSFGK